MDGNRKSENSDINMEVSVRRYAEGDDANTGLLRDPCETASDTENAENYRDMLQSTGIRVLGDKKPSDKEPLVEKTIGKAVQQSPPYDVKHQRDFDIKYKDDKKDCNVNGSVMMDTDRLAICDYDNSMVKVVDAHQGNILSYTRLILYPLNITYTDQNQLVVTAPCIRKLVFLDVGKTLTVNKELKVDGRCYGIDYANSKLIVSFLMPSSVKILNMDGHVLSSFSKDRLGQPLFSLPEYVISSADSSAIYVSDWQKNAVTKLDMTGRVIYKYTGNECKSPFDLVVDQYDNLYIAGYLASTVCILSAEGRLINTIKDDWPVSIALCEDTDQLFVSHGFLSSSRNSLSVYKLH